MTATAKITTSSTDDGSYWRFALAQIECAALRARLKAAEIETICVALRGGFTDADGAIEWLHDVDPLDLIATSSADVTP